MRVKRKLFSSYSEAERKIIEDRGKDASKRTMVSGGLRSVGVGALLGYARHEEKRLDKEFLRNAAGRDVRFGKLESNKLKDATLRHSEDWAERARAKGVSKEKIKEELFDFWKSQGEKYKDIRNIAAKDARENLTKARKIKPVRSGLKVGIPVAAGGALLTVAASKANKNKEKARTERAIRTLNKQGKEVTAESVNDYLRKKK